MSSIKSIPSQRPRVQPAEDTASSTSLQTTPEPGAGLRSTPIRTPEFPALTPADQAKVLGQVEAPASPPTASTQVADLRATFDGLQTIGGGPAQARLLQDNLDSWNARWKLLESATTSIDTAYFSLEKDVFGFAFLGLLLKKQLDGVPVRVMTDAMADTFGQRGFKMPLRGKDYLQELANHGGQAYIFHPIWQRPLDLVRGDYSPLASNHDKTLVVDGRHGITGGRNIGIDYLTSVGDRPHAWRDLDVALEGEGPAAALTASIDAELKQGDLARRVKPDRLGNWVKRDLELVGAYVLMDLWLKDPPLRDDEKQALRADPAAQEKMVDALVQRALARLPSELPPRLRREAGERERSKLHELATQLCQQLDARGSRHRFDAAPPAVHASDTKVLDQTSSAGVRANDFAAALTALCDSATTRIVIENPYVVLTEQMLEAMERASRRGVEIQIITNSPLSTDSAVTQAFFLEDWPYVLARCPTARIFVATGDQKFHSKSGVIDDKVSLVTTYNMDLLSGYVNSEVGAAVWSESMARELTQVFDRDLADPRNGFLEYTIARLPDGRPRVEHGKPTPTFGPEDHLPQQVLDAYRGKRKLWGHTLRDHALAFAPLRHPPLEDTV